jgi:WD40 repeat protein
MAFTLRLALVGLLAAAGTLHGSDPTLPASASLRLGDNRFRAGGEVIELHFSTDGTEVTSRVALDDHRTRSTLWNVATGLPLAVTTEPRRTGSRLRWGATDIPNTNCGILIDADGLPLVRDFNAEKDLAKLTGHCSRVTAVAVSPDGKRIATASVDGFIRVWDASTYRPLHQSTGHIAAVRSLELAPDGRTLLTVGADRTARIWDLATGRERRAFSIPDGSHPCFTANGAALCIRSRAGDEVRDLVTGLEITSPVVKACESLPLVHDVMDRAGICLALAPDGRTLAIGKKNGSIDLIETASWQVRRTLPGHGGSCLDLVFTADGTRLVSAGADHSVFVWPVRLRDVTLTAELKRQTDAAVLWNGMAYGTGRESTLAMARLAADPAAAVGMARICLKPGSVANPIADARAVELLESVGTLEARALLRELAEHETDSTRKREARLALTRLGDVRYSRDGVRTIGGQK